jgi:light-regulated signal transduction histidine kinase (bacteriophytochrome)
MTRQALPDDIADALHLCQSFQNLVGNALKCRKRGTVPEVRINAKREVAGAGIGLATLSADC